MQGQNTRLGPFGGESGSIHAPDLPAELGDRVTPCTEFPTLAFSILLLVSAPGYWASLTSTARTKP